MKIKLLNLILLLFIILLAGTLAFVYFDPSQLKKAKQIFPDIAGASASEIIMFIPSNNQVTISANSATISLSGIAENLTLTSDLLSLIRQEARLLESSKLVMNQVSSEIFAITGQEGCGELRLTMDLELTNLKYIECVNQR